MHHVHTRIKSLLMLLAARQQGPGTDKVLPQTGVVGNGFISPMACQAKGYAYIAP